MLTATRKTLGAVVSVVSVVAVLVMAYLTQSRLETRPRTDDAYLLADIVHMAPDVSGRVIELNVKNNQRVVRDSVLFRIDPEPFRLRVQQAQASVRGLEARLGLTADQVAAQTSSAETAERGISSAQAQLALATSTLARMEPLLPRGYVTPEQIDQARTAKRTAEVALQQARLQATSARQAITNTKPVEQELEAARATLALAERDLRLTEVRSPCDGIITALDIAAGEFAVTGHPLFSIIDTEQWWAVGNFRETDLHGMHPGQSSTVYVLANPQRPLRGIVDSLGGGVAPDEGMNLFGLPHVPRSLNWVRVAQRFPVRILLKDAPPDLMRIGATVAIVIDK